MNRRGVINDDDDAEENVEYEIGAPIEADHAGDGKPPKSIWDEDSDEEETSQSRKRPAAHDAFGGVESAKKKFGGPLGDDDVFTLDQDDDEYYDDIEGARVDWKSEQAKVLRQCESFSASLRAALGKWDENAAKASNGAVNPKMGQDGCVRMTKINTVDSGVLTDADFAPICPNLKLKEYQLVGVNWLKLLHFNPPVNGVLADDMGLGKTIQTIAFLGWLKANNQMRGNFERLPHLIVVPASTLSNWEKELARHLPDFEIASYHGSVNDRTDLRRDLRNKIDQGAMDIILTTYSIFEKEACGADRAFMKNRNFDYIVLDEAHCLKNSSSSRFMYLNQITPKHRLLLSGTPVQNNVFELLSLLSFIMPSVFSHRVATCLGHVFKEERKVTGMQAQETLRNLRSMLAPFVLRRLKSDVLNQLVDKRCIKLEVEPTDFQWRVYESIITAHARRKERVRQMLAEQELESKVLGDTVCRGAKKKAVLEKGKTATSATTAVAASSVVTELVDLTDSPATSGSSSIIISSSSSSSSIIIGKVLINIISCYNIVIFRTINEIIG